MKTKRNAASYVSRKSRKGFTMMEMVVAMAIGTMLAIAATKTMIMFSRQVTHGASVLEQNYQLRETMSNMGEDIRYAKSIEIISAYRIEITDANTNTVVYRWSGTPGDSLIAEDDFGNTKVLIANVQSLGFDITDDNRGINFSVLVKKNILSGQTASNELSNISFTTRESNVIS